MSRNRLRVLIAISIGSLFGVFCFGETTAQLRQQGIQAYKKNDYVSALKYLFAYQQIAGHDLEPEALQNLESIIAYCEDHVVSITTSLGTTSGSSSALFQWVSPGRLTEVNMPSTGGVFLTSSGFLYIIDNATGGVLLSSDGTVRPIPKQQEEQIITELEQPSLLSMPLIETNRLHQQIQEQQELLEEIKKSVQER
ncbi:hypothetical protein [Sediminispirochaeta bajacaliforniensis]|uniref:hypothetical protein n=1 Tax=Sediminispirochaeta bajacaliforniensis TaxID=148 RepID=UPI00036B12A2|nr:hypothetical protein [Sediminispirochaeta bajacaliforniensis]